MTITNTKKLYHLTSITRNEAIDMLVRWVERRDIPEAKPLLLSQIAPSNEWESLNQGLKGYLGKEFYQIHRQLGFKFCGKGLSGTTHIYRYTGIID